MTPVLGSGLLPLTWLGNGKRKSEGMPLHASVIAARLAVIKVRDLDAHKHERAAMSDYTIKRTCPLCKHSVFMSPTTGQIKPHPRIPGQWCTVTELRVTVTRKAKSLKRQPTRKSQKNQEAKRNADLVRSHTEAWVRSVFSHARCPSCDRVVSYEGTKDALVFTTHWGVFSQAERCVQSGSPVPVDAIGVHGRKRPDGTFNCGLCGLLVSGRANKPAPHYVAGAQRWCRAAGPPTSRGSVFTLSAGLPGLGKRR